MVFFTAASQRRLLVVDVKALSRNETGFQPAAQVINVGTGPWDVALSSDGRLIFVANRFGDNVQIISTASGAIIGSVSVGLSPVSLHLGAGGRYLYVASTTGRTVSVVDVGAFSNGGESAGRAAPTVQDTIFLSSVGWLTGTSDGTRLVVTMPSDDSVTIIDMVDNSVLHVIPVGDAPQMIVIGPDDRTAYVPNFISETVTVIDVRTGSVTDEIPLAEGARGAVGVAVSPDGRYLYVTRWSAVNELDRGTLEKIDLVSRKTVARIEVGPQPFDVEISPDGRLAVVSSFTGMVATVDLAAERSVLAEVGAGMMGGLAFAVASGN
ncbi:MAG: beta-propeller fold lactonase family protein [Gemmatimonadetes bacterium]|nr:beta-propeller fold lactonase family protein [Gemmatimonadota bacterium]